MTATLSPVPSPYVVQLVPHGTAEQLARVAHFRELDNPDAPELDCVARFLIGDVGGRDSADLVWGQLRDDCLRLWHLITDDWDDRDLDDLSFDDARRMDVAASPDQEEQVRYERTRNRLVGDIEAVVYRARYGAVAARRSAAHRDQALDAAMVRHPAGAKFPGGVA